MRLTAQTVLAQRPHVLVIIDSPGFTRGIARRVRAKDRGIAIVEYVSPSVWAWRPGRARVMRRYIDHILALLPFEPDVHRRLGGPACTYVGHPLTEELDKLRPNEDEMRRRLARPPLLLVLPGSRRGEIERLLGIFGDAVRLVHARVPQVEVVLPTTSHLRELVARLTRCWPLPPRIVTESAEKQAAFRSATAALAKSGTVTLELALAGVPMVSAYKDSALEYWTVGRGILKRLRSIILPNLLVGEAVVPELLQQDCTPERLVAALLPLLSEGPERRAQLAGFARLDAILDLRSERAPALRAAPGPPRGRCASVSFS